MVKKPRPKSKNKKNKFALLQPRPLNLIAAGIYILQSLLVVLLSNPERAGQPLTTGFLAENKAASLATGQNVSAQASHLLLEFNLAYLVAGFLAVAGVAHLLAATRLRAAYETGLKDKVNRFRWISYSAVLGLVMVAISFLSGIFDLSMLIMIFGLTLVLGITGAMVEKRGNDKKTGWLPYMEGLKLGLVPFVVILIYAWGSYAYGGSLPAYLYFIYLTLLLLFSAMIINFYLQIKKMGHWSDYLFSEKTFILVSLIAISALAWQIFFGALR